MFHIIKRGISTTASLSGKRNFRKFLLYNKRGTRIFKQQRAANPELYPDMPIDKRGVRDTGVTIDGKFIEIKERIPELVVPNLEGCKLKPYVSYKAPDVVQSEFTISGAAATGFLLDTNDWGTNSSAFSSSNLVALVVGSSHVSDMDLKTNVFSLFSLLTLAGDALCELLDDFEELPLRLLLEVLVEDVLLELLEDRRYRDRSCDLRS
uniref:Uncharacterized protein n=1 Tax=Anopheles culicifacies TaxID=139723 RepID=A0A182MEQ5_9DIPT